MNNNNLIRSITIADIFPSTNLQEFLKTPRVPYFSYNNHRNLESLSP